MLTFGIYLYVRPVSFFFFFEKNSWIEQQIIYKRLNNEILLANDPA